MGRRKKRVDILTKMGYNIRMELLAFEEKDFASLYDFMRPLWLETYGGFLPEAQIELLLKKYFSPEGLHNFRAQGYRYFKIDSVGVLVYLERETEVFLDKLYLLPEARGKGYAAFAISQLMRLNKDVVLNVNQQNKRAIACYEKNGFTVDKTVDIDLGGGMVNRDYILRKKPF